VNRQNAASLLQPLTPIDVPNHLALLGNALQTEEKNPRNKISKLMTQRIRSASAIGAMCIDTSMYFFHFSFYLSVSLLGEQFAAFCLFMGTSSKNCGLLGENGNTLKIKTTAKLKDKRTSIATVRGLYRMYATFPIPLGSHYRLPLMWPLIA